MRIGQVAPAPAPGIAARQQMWTAGARLQPQVQVQAQPSAYEAQHRQLQEKARGWSDSDVRGLYAAALNSQPYGDSRAEQVQAVRPYIVNEMVRRGFMVSTDQCMVGDRPGVAQSAMTAGISPMHKAAMVGGGLLLAGSVALNFWYYTRWQPKR